MTDVDVVVIGAGLMGSAAARALSRRNRSVALIEAFEPGHVHGSSHGSSRIFRRAYPDETLVTMTGRAAALWQELEEDSRTELLTWTGAVDHGRSRDPVGLAEFLTRQGVECSLLDADEAGERWPGMRFDGPVLFHPEAGVIDADAAVLAAVDCARVRGAALLSSTRVRTLQPEREHVRVHTDRGASLTASSVVVAAGPWLPELAPALGVATPLPRLTVTQQQVFHFPQRDPDATWPVFVHKHNLQIYGLPSGRDGGRTPALKVAQHDDGMPTTASSRTGTIDAAGRRRVTDHVERWLPGLVPVPTAASTCLYTTTPDEDFLLDRVGPVVVLSPCSGHGAKFAPLIGEIAADLATGAARPHPRFGLDHA